MTKTAALTLFALSLTTAAHSDSLRLSCQGVTTRTVENTTSMSLSNNRGDTATGTASSYGRRESADHLVVEIDKGSGRIRLPSNMIPAFHGAGAGDGWWTLTDVRENEDEISGRYSLNMLNHPAVRIDRRSGAVEVDGFRHSYRGTCNSVADTPRKF